MKSIANFLKSLRVPDKDFKLSNFDTRVTENFQKQTIAAENLENDIEAISKLQNKLYAEDNQSLLIIFQGMDSAGKDGTIKNIMKGVNPQGVLVTSFKHPSTQELEHDYLWRHTLKLPEHGQIVIFNRSYYENVLISKVHPELVLAERIKRYDKLSKIGIAFWKMRYNQINHFEKRNIETGTQILKFFLHLSIDEQCRRFLERINNEDKHWKFSSTDIEERKYWNDYQNAYEQAIKLTSTKIAPWFIIPADDKSIAHILIGKIILDKLKKMKPIFPAKTKQEEKYMQEAKVNLEYELQIKY
jgi:PPK2 family polyphosphate:nucleotide phosphotransferase